VSQEPEYLRRLRASQERGSPRTDVGPGGEQALTLQEREALRWGREAAGTDLRAVRGLPGARYVVLLRVPSATGVKYHSLEGLPSREALMDRLLPGSGMGEEVVAAYEVRGGRPIKIEIVDSEIKLRMGDPRPGAHPVNPEKMLRKAAALAAQRARTRPDKTGKGKGR